MVAVLAVLAAAADPVPTKVSPHSIVVVSVLAMFVVVVLGPIVLPFPFCFVQCLWLSISFFLLSIPLLRLGCPPPTRFF